MPVERGPQPRSPLPWNRKTFSGSTDSWIEDSADKDIARISPSRLMEPPESAVVAITDKDAEVIVYRVNNWEDLCQRLEKAEAEVERLKASNAHWNSKCVMSLRCNTRP